MKNIPFPNLKLLPPNFLSRIWSKDSSLWSQESSARTSIESRLGWLNCFETFQKKVEEIETFTQKVLQDGIQDVLLLGMGGSSLCPDVFQRIFSSQKGFPNFYVLDSTDPENIREIERKLNLSKTLFLVSSKSGTTAEINALYQYFSSPSKPSQFVAITDSGTPLQEIASKKGFRACFINPSDIGGRFSALSYFGLVPASLMGIQIEKILSSALEMQTACKQENPEKNLGLSLGLVLAQAFLQKRDKMTLLFSKHWEPLGDWIEQLVAESSGKKEKGLLPIVGEPLEAPTYYGDDRFFIHVVTSDVSLNSENQKKVQDLTKAGLPVFSISILDPYQLGGEFFRWEFATAVAASIMEINPFDEPNVRQNKELTKTLLHSFEQTGSLPNFSEASFEQLLPYFSQLEPDQFVALLAYLPYSSSVQRELNLLRNLIQKKTKKATTLGFGPRFLHSTGQYHKGGPNKGFFLQFVMKDEELPIPGEKFGFGILKKAQAIGDYQTLCSNHRKILVLDLGFKPEKKLSELRSFLEKNI